MNEGTDVNNMINRVVEAFKNDMMRYGKEIGILLRLHRA